MANDRMDERRGHSRSSIEPCSRQPRFVGVWTRQRDRVVLGWRLDLAANGRASSRTGVLRECRAIGEPDRGGVGAQPEIGGQRWPSRRFQASLRETGMPRAVMRLSTLQGVVARITDQELVMWVWAG